MGISYRSLLRGSFVCVSYIADRCIRKELLAERLEEAQVEVEWVAVLLAEVDKKGPAILRQPKVRFDGDPGTVKTGTKSDKGKGKGRAVEVGPESSKGAKDKAKQAAPVQAVPSIPMDSQAEPESPGMRAERRVTAENRAEKRLVSAMKQRDTDNESPVWFAQFSEGLSYKIMPKDAEPTKDRPDSRSPEEAALETKVLTAEYIKSVLEDSASTGVPLSPGAERKAKFVQLPRISPTALAERSASFHSASRPADPRSPKEAAVDSQVLTPEIIKSVLQAPGPPGPAIAPGAERKAELVERPKVKRADLGMSSATLQQARRPTEWEKETFETYRKAGKPVIQSLSVLGLAPPGPKQREPVMSPITEVTESSSEDVKGEEERGRRR